MNKNILLTLIVLVFFSTWLNSALAYASFSKALNVYPKSVIAAPNTIWVPDNYTTIQEAINMANEGETILVEAGTYYEHVIVNKPLSLVGENKQDTIIDGSGAETIVNIIASNITLSGFTIQNGGLGIYLWGSSNNVISGNDVSNNGHGIYLSYSGDNVVSGNNVSENEHGIYLWGSSNNIFFQNNFINCTEPSSSIASVDSWDNGVEGNYWSDYNGTDTDWDGINDTPYHISENSRDNYPLMARFLQFNIVAENQSYRITTVCNFTISDFQCYYDLDAKTNAVSFNVNSTGDKGFCRISIPHALIDPPFKVRIDSRPPSYSKKVYANGTHTWLYFAYDHSEHEVTIVHTPPSEQLLWSQWSIIGLAITVAILFLIGVRYYRLFNKQKKVIEAYEREVGSFPVSHEERARMRFVKDVIEREEKLEKFKAKYGIKIQPANTLTDVMEKLGVQKES
jgi:parallel beta-helix repeat protein